MPGKYLRGALIAFNDTFPLPVANLILFQYNPEQLTHAWTPTTLASTGEGAGRQGNPLATAGEPGESFSFTLFMDATDGIADDGPIGEALGMAHGVGTRIAALEMLLFPNPPSAADLVGSVTAALTASVGVKRQVPAGQLPTVLFVWGPGRIVPVRVSALSFTETLYDPVLLAPTHAQATVTLDVLTTAQVAALGGTLGELAQGAYRYTNSLRQMLAQTNAGNTTASIAGMLPI